MRLKNLTFVCLKVYRAYEKVQDEQLGQSRHSKVSLADSPKITNSNSLTEKWIENTDRNKIPINKIAQ